MLAQEVVQKYDKLTTADAVVGTGPFIMKSVQEKVAADYVRNPDYWKPGFPYLAAARRCCKLCRSGKKASRRRSSAFGNRR